MSAGASATDTSSSTWMIMCVVRPSITLVTLVEVPPPSRLTVSRVESEMRCVIERTVAAWVKGRPKKEQIG